MKYRELVRFWKDIVVGDIIEDHLSKRVCRVCEIRTNYANTKIVVIEYAGVKTMRNVWELRPIVDYWSNFPEVRYEKA